MTETKVPLAVSVSEMRPAAPQAARPAAVREHYRRLVARRVAVILALTAALVALTFLALCAGAASFGWREALRAVLAGPWAKAGAGSLSQTVVWQLRMPRICMGILGGGALGLAGAMMQGLLRNPLASPFTLGVASASGFGAALAITFGIGSVGWGQWLIVGNAFLFALLASGVVFVLAQWRGMSKETMILAGVATMYLFSALTSLLQYMGGMEQVNSVVFWLLGSLERATWLRCGLVAVVALVTFPWMYSLSWDLNVMGSGDEAARSLGVSVKRVRMTGMFLASLATAGVICFSGTIGFIGLVAPHISRMLVGVDHRFHLPASLLTGSVLLVAADLAARTVLVPHVLPLGIMTSCVGVPFFFYLVVRHRKEMWQK
jgi:iron complex transport system permease protein